jgi:hypothetical protein
LTPKIKEEFFMKTVNEIREAIEAKNTRSAWSRGVKEYAMELLDELEEAISGGYFDAEDIEAPALLIRQLLNGASDWEQYSWGGCSLIYNQDIAERLCNASELEKTRHGERRPNAQEDWLDTQARALGQAARLILQEARA